MATATEPAAFLKNEVNTSNAISDNTSDQDDGTGQHISLTSDSSGSSSLPSTPSSQQASDEADEMEVELKCSAVHTLERDMPDFDYTNLVDELRAKVLDEIQRNPGCYSQCDIDKCRNDDWHIRRFLLRNKLQVQDAFDMICKAMRFNHESLCNSLRPEDFPAEFYQLGGLFSYEPDRKGNKMVYMRIALHRKTPEIQAILQAFIYYSIRRADEEANGRGITLCFICTGGGLVNADMDTLLFIINTLKNYFPKGLSYFLVHELPWILKPFWHIAKTWIPDEYRQLIKFSDSRTIYEYVARENLPDFMGGTCKRPYRDAPENCTTMEEASKLWGVDHHTMRKVLVKFQENLPEETVSRIYRYLEECERAEMEKTTTTTAAENA